MFIEGIKKGLQFLWEENWKFKTEAQNDKPTTDNKTFENGIQTENIPSASSLIGNILPTGTAGIDHSIENIRRAHQASIDLVVNHPELFGALQREHLQNSQE